MRVADADDDEEIDDEFLPIIRILGEERREFQRLGVERLTLRLQFLNPPVRGENNIGDYNRILSGWLHRAFINSKHKIKH